MLLELDKLSVADRQRWLQSAIAPRPIGLVSTINKQGVPNLAPFSFFNLFSANPPIAVFSPVRRVRDHMVKHSLLNVQDIPEAVINMVSYDMLHRVNLASAEFPASVNEFSKAGLGMERATLVRPPMVKESKLKFECRVTELKPLGNQGGAGTMVFCELLRLHISGDLVQDGGIDPARLDLVARLGANWYCRINPGNLFELPKPSGEPSGTDQLPMVLQESDAFSSEHLAQLAIGPIPPGRQITTDPSAHLKAVALLDSGDIQSAWEALTV